MRFRFRQFNFHMSLAVKKSERKKVVKFENPSCDDEEKLENKAIRQRVERVGNKKVQKRRGALTNCDDGFTAMLYFVIISV